MAGSSFYPAPLFGSMDILLSAINPLLIGMQGHPGGLLTFCPISSPSSECYSASAEWCRCIGHVRKNKLLCAKCFSLGRSASLMNPGRPGTTNPNRCCNARRRILVTQSAEKRRPLCAKRLVAGCTRRLNAIGLDMTNIMRVFWRKRAAQMRIITTVLSLLFSGSLFLTPAARHGEFKIAERHLNFGRKRRARRLCFVPSFCK